MSTEEMRKIIDISKSFASEFKDAIGPINGSGWLIVDPLSGYLNSIGLKHKLFQLPESDKHPQILVMEFPDGTQLIPSGEDLKGVFPQAENWMWIESSNASK